MIQMIESYLLNYLNTSALEDRAYMEDPDETNQRFYTVEKTGSDHEDGIETATFAIRSVSRRPGGSLEQAARMNLMLKAELKALAAQPEIANVDINSDYNDTDTQTKSYAYQCVVDVAYYPDLVDKETDSNG